MKKKLKNLYNKKGVKIAIHIINALVYGFTIFMIVLLSVGSCANQHNKQPILKEEIPIKEVIDYQNGAMKGISVSGILCDRHSFEYLYNRYMVYFNTANVGTPNIHQDYTTTLASYISLFHNVEISSGNAEPANRSYFNSIRMECTNAGTITGADNNMYVKSFNFSLYKQATTSVVVGPVVSVDLIFSKTAYDDTSDYNTYLYHTWNITSTPSNIGWYFARVHRNNTAIYDLIEGDDYNNGFIAGQADGYSSGYTNGYNDGDNAGYNRGYTEGANNNESNIFSIIDQGFSAVTTLFNIQIFPGITLATLVFIPMIVVIVIALMHIFKG